VIAEAAGPELSPIFQAELIKLADAGDDDAGKAIFRILCDFDIAELSHGDQLLACAEDWARRRELSGDDVVLPGLCALITVRAAVHLQRREYALAMLHAAEAIARADTLADADHPIAGDMVTEISHWLAAKGFGPEVHRMAKMMLPGMAH